MNNQQLWQAILGELEVSLSKANFNTWLKNTSICEKEDNYMVILVPSSFASKWIKDKYQGEILKALKRFAPEVREIRYLIGNQNIKSTVQGQATEKVIQNQVANQEAKPTFSESQVTGSNIDNKPGLNTKYTFETFIIGKNNDIAHAASVGVAKNPGVFYNPLFIYGGVGLGKTHLLHAAGNYIKEKNKAAKIVYVTTENYTNDYIYALQHKKMEEFRSFYRNIDVLLLDDVQFFAGKEQTQEVFFHTFNDLKERNKQIIMTCDRLPSDIPALEQRLINRFEWGMMADVQAPDFEIRLAILKAKSQYRGILISEDILRYIAENVVSNIRELEGTLNRLMVFQQMENQPLNLDQAKNILASIVNSKKKMITLKKIINSVAEFYSITTEDLIKQSRKKEFVKPRQIAMFLARKELNASFPSIGEFFGGRDHTTVIHGVEKVNKLLEMNKLMKQEVDLILDKMYTNS